jgi:hypothetical protein
MELGREWDLLSESMPHQKCWRSISAMYRYRPLLHLQGEGTPPWHAVLVSFTSRMC